MDETIDGNVTRASDFWTMGPLSRSHASIARHSRTAHDRSARGDTDTPLHFHHRSGGGGGAGQAAKDATGADIKSKVWLKTHLPGDHTLSQGLKVRVAAPHRIHRGGSRRARGLARAPSRASEPNRDVDRGVSPPRGVDKAPIGSLGVSPKRNVRARDDDASWQAIEAFGGNARSKQSAENAFGEHESRFWFFLTFRALRFRRLLFARLIRR